MIAYLYFKVKKILKIVKKLTFFLTYFKKNVQKMHSLFVWYIFKTVQQLNKKSLWFQSIPLSKYLYTLG
jgi:hypothetical protein